MKKHPGAALKPGVAFNLGSSRVNVEQQDSGTAGAAFSLEIVEDEEQQESGFLAREADSPGRLSRVSDPKQTDPKSSSSASKIAINLGSLDIAPAPKQTDPKSSSSASKIATNLGSLDIAPAPNQTDAKSSSSSSNSSPFHALAETASKSSSISNDNSNSGAIFSKEY